jgi:hypothetical protein
MKKGIVFLGLFLMGLHSFAQEWGDVPAFQGTTIIQKFEIIRDELCLLGAYYIHPDTSSLVVRLVENEFLPIRSGVYSTTGGGRDVIDLDTSICVVGNFAWFGGDSQFRDVAFISEDGNNYRLPNVSFTTVKDVELFHNKLYFAGVVTSWYGDDNFDDNTEISGSKLVCFDGDSVSLVGTPLGYNLTDLTVFQDELYALGKLAGYSPDNSSDNIVPASNIMRYNGATWNTVAGGVDDYIRCNVVDSINDVLYIAGDFTTAGGGAVDAFRVAYWDGEAYHPVGEGLSGGLIHSLCMYRGQLYAGGNNILGSYDLAYFNGAEWKPVDEENYGIVTGQVEEMTVFDDKLYISGQFDLVGDAVETNGLVWYFLDPADIDIGRPTNVGESTSSDDIKIYPNPANDVAWIHYPKEADNLGTIQVHDNQGRSISAHELKSNGLLEMSVAGFTPGVYHIVILLEGEVIDSCKLVVQ